MAAKDRTYDFVVLRRNRKFVPAAMGAGEGHPSPWQPITMLVSAAMEQSAVACWGQRLRRLVPVSGIKRKIKGRPKLQRFRQIHRKASARLNLAVPLSCIAAPLKGQSRCSRRIYSRHESKERGLIPSKSIEVDPSRSLRKSPFQLPGIESKKINKGKK